MPISTTVEHPSAFIVYSEQVSVTVRGAVLRPAGVRLGLDQDIGDRRGARELKGGHDCMDE